MRSTIPSFIETDVVDRWAGRLPPIVIQMVFGLGCTGGAVLVRFGIDLVAPTAGPLALIQPATLVATLFGRWRAGLVTLVATLLWAWYFVLPPAGAFHFENRADLSRIAVNALAAVSILVLAEIFRAAVRRAARQRDEEVARRDALLAELAGGARRLAQSEEQLRLATEAAEIGLWDLDVRAGDLYWQPRVKAMWGIPAEAAVSMDDFYAGLHPEDIKPTRAAFAAASDPAGNGVFDVEYRVIPRDDWALRWVAAKGRAMFENGECVRVIGTVIDVTARKVADKTLRELNETLERRVTEAVAEQKILAEVIEATDAIIQVIDNDYRLMALNRAGADASERLYGVRPKVGDSILELLEDHARPRDAARALWGRALAGEEFTLTQEILDPGHDRRHFELKFNALRDRDGRQIGAFQFVHDVTERQRDQARLAEAERQLGQAQKIEAIGQLTGGVAHDFNNLLMVILGGLSILDRPSSPERRGRIMDGMRQAAERGASLSRQLLGFARRQPLRPEPVDLKGQLDGMRDLLEGALRGDVRIDAKFSDELWPVKVDPAELELVVLNLIVNARDAMPGGGAIAIRGENAPGLADGELNGDFIRLTVADTGCGMTAEVLARVFEPFFTTKEVGKGSGLGLPQVYGFAHQSGGTVSIESAVGEGTTVTLLLPRSDAEPAKMAAPTLLAQTDRTPAPLNSILLVEDDDEVAALATEMLRELGYHVIRAAGPEAALGALADHREVDMVFSDIMMPGPMNGLDLIREMRRRRPGLPVLLTTGFADAAAREAEAGGLTLLRKPYEIAGLAEALAAAFGGGEAFPMPVSPHARSPRRMPGPR